MPYKERSLYNVFESIKIQALNHGIPNCIIEEAKNLYKRIAEKNFTWIKPKRYYCFLHL